MRLIVQQCSKQNYNKSCSSLIFPYVKERYTNVILNGIEWILYFTPFMQPHKQNVPMNINKQKTRKQ